MSRKPKPKIKSDMFTFESKNEFLDEEIREIYSPSICWKIDKALVAFKVQPDSKFMKINYSDLDKYTMYKPRYVGIYLNVCDPQETFNKIISLKGLCTISNINKGMEDKNFGLQYDVNFEAPTSIKAYTMFTIPSKEWIKEYRLTEEQQLIWNKGFTLCRFCNKMSNFVKFGCSLEVLSTCKPEWKVTEKIVKNFTFNKSDLS